VALARVVTFEGGTPEGVRAAADQVKSDIQREGGPPEGVTSSGLTFLVDPDGSRAMFVGIFASEDDLRSSEAALNAMDPPEGMGTRSSVAVYEVAADIRM
jgi:hypothetical protein